jgi:hypothetical protein
MPFISCTFLNNKIHYTKNPHTFLHSLWADRANFNKALQSSWWRSSRMEPRHGLQMPSSSDQLDFFRKMYSFSSRRMLAKTAGMRAGGSFGQPWSQAGIRAGYQPRLPIHSHSKCSKWEMPTANAANAANASSQGNLRCRGELWPAFKRAVGEAFGISPF